MGHYHEPCNATKFETLSPFAFDSGLKMAEIIFSRPSAAAGTAVLLGAPVGDRPADLHGAPARGHWAGDAVALVGDCTGTNDYPVSFTAHFECIPDDEIYFTFENATDRSVGAVGGIEAAAHVRLLCRSESNYSNHSRVVEIESDESGHRPAWSEDPDIHRMQERMWPDDVSKLVNRPPRGGAVQVGTDEASIADGQRRLVISLDAGAYFDPTAVGDVPTLAGVVRGTSAALLTAALAVPDKRGGGDVDPRVGGAFGAWRGHRVAVVGEERSGHLPSIEDVVHGFADATPSFVELLRGFNEVYDEMNPPATAHERTRLASLLTA